MVSPGWREMLAELEGAPPPALLRARLVEDADEILVCTYTADLRFFEATCLPEARAVRARVTVIHDAAVSIVPPGELRHAGTAYTDVPVRCRSGGEFHPKLLLIAGQDRAIAAIGSGNATSAGWHHNAELWTVLGASSDEWLETFADLAGWLRRLPDALHIDPFGASRIRDIADLVSSHQPTIPGPQLVHNLGQSIMRALPDLAASGGAAELGIASPFLDGVGAALNQLTKRLAPAAATLALTPRVVGPVGEMARWASGAGRQVRSIAGSRYHHGKLVEWRRGQSYEVLVGSANVTAAAMLRTTGDLHGNCELGLLLDTRQSLLPALLDDPINPEDLGGHLEEPPAHREDGTGVRLLRILIEAAGTTAYLTGTDAADASAQLTTPTGPVPMRSGPAVPGAVMLVADTRVAAGTLCSIMLADGTTVGPVRATDPVAVRLRPGSGSPLEDESLPRVLSHPQLSDRLFEALALLALVRPDTAQGTSGHTGRVTTWRAEAERAVGSALVALALGGHRAATDIVEDDEMPTRDERDEGTPAPSLGDAVDESVEDDDVGTWDGEEVDIGIDDPWDIAHDPVSLLLADAVTARRIARLVERRLEELEQWQLPGVLALLRVSLLVAAGGGWDAETWPAVVACLLDSLKPAELDNELEASRQAAGTVGLAALASQIDSWEKPSELRTWFETLRAALAIDIPALDSRLIAHYTADLHLGLGQQLTADGVLDAADFLVTGSPLSRVAEGLADSYPGIRLAARRLLELEAAGTPRTIVLRLLAQCSEYAPIAVRLHTRDSTVFAAWRQKLLLLHYGERRGSRGAEYQLPIGPGTYAAQAFPPAVRSWTGAIPIVLQRELIEDGLLDGDLDV